MLMILIMIKKNKINKSCQQHLSGAKPNTDDYDHVGL
jgi:hypothetical protein